MPDKIIPLVVPFRRRREILAREKWDSPEPSDLMVWEVCPYLRMDMENWQCMGCPAWEDDERHGKVQKMCRGLAEEACRAFMAVQRREANSEQE